MIQIGTTFVDRKGRAWEVIERLPFGYFRVRTIDRSRVRERRGKEIRAMREVNAIKAPIEQFAIKDPQQQRRLIAQPVE